MKTRFIVLSAPRSGSTALCDLFNSNPQIQVCGAAGELLAEHLDIPGDVFSYVEDELCQSEKEVRGFKVFPRHLISRNLNLDALVEQLNIRHVFVLWRQNTVESIVSRLIAEDNNQWHSMKDNDVVHKVNVDPAILKKNLQDMEKHWREIFSHWPFGITPIFLSYEQLFPDYQSAIKPLLAKMGVEFFGWEEVYGRRQNPATLEAKIANFAQLPPELLETSIDVPKIFAETLESTFNLRGDTYHLLPDKEPDVPPSGWRYRVAEPFLPDTAKQNVMDALDGRTVSSAGLWPRRLSEKLKELFQVPVAQPCCNGFAGLVLALQLANVKQGDEVIIPSFTMIAVANAVSFAGGTPVLVDNAPGQYGPSWNEISKAATPKTKAVIVSPLYGVPIPDLELIAEQCKERGWPLIEDISECMGVKFQSKDGTNKLLGTVGDFAVASMYANKIVQAADGGFVIAKDPAVEKRLTSLVNHGFTKTFHFVHFEKATNAKINGLGAALACGNLDHLGHIMQHRAALCATYRENLKDTGLQLMPKCGPMDTPWVFSCHCKTKEERTLLRSHLASYGIETRDFFFPIHLQPAFSDISGRVRLPHAEHMGSTGFYFPTHSDLKTEDVEFICEVTKHYFENNDFYARFPLAAEPPSNPQLQALRVKPDVPILELRTFDASGVLTNVSTTNHIIHRSGELIRHIRRHLYTEEWDATQAIAKECHQVLGELQGFEPTRDYISRFLRYIEAYQHYELPTRAPWKHIDLSSDDFKEARSMPTTTDKETLQLLVWIVKEYNPRNILELGCWFGHASALMALAAGENPVKVYAADTFNWKEWMQEYHQPADEEAESFLKSFIRNTEFVSEKIQPLIWNINTNTCPIELVNEKLDLVYMDFTQQSEDMENAWKIIQPRLTEDHSLLLFNGLTDTSLEFFTNHANELEPIAKPNAIAKLFKYKVKVVMETEEKESDEEPEIVYELLPRKLCFTEDPQWSHHHQNAFSRAITALHERLHDPDAQCLFIPAVGQFICDAESIPDQPWIGIIHTVPEYPELFYVPDLTRLCSPKYNAWMANCKGLFTLTQLQAEFLRENLSSQWKFPICPLKYPIVEPEAKAKSVVLSNLHNSQKVKLVLIGSFARDFKYFFDVQVGDQFQKAILLGDEWSESAAQNAPLSVEMVPRASGEEYEKLLTESVVFLSLRYDGAANTLILECIARNVPIVAPRLWSIEEYIGNDYPLLYNPGSPNLTDILTESNIQAAIEYLQAMDKKHLSLEIFCTTVCNSTVLASVPPHLNSKSPLDFSIHDHKYDVTVAICSYKRTHNLEDILDRLWNKQSFEGKLQIIVWNNNSSRTGVVKKLCSRYMKRSDSSKTLELISSSENHYCSVRFAMAQLMRSELLLICDDDVLPEEGFISFFTDGHQQHRNDILCVRGHYFLPHELPMTNPEEVWNEYEFLRFADDAQPERFIHFVHADACLIPKAALHEVASVNPPNDTFYLVDDYWMSFILNHKFGRNLRKLSTTKYPLPVLQRTIDSSSPGLALHTRPEVNDARVQLYIHHMLHGWPRFQQQPMPIHTDDAVAKAKQQVWKNRFIGYNVCSSITRDEVRILHNMGVHCVRIGAVCGGRQTDYEFSTFLSDPVVAAKQLHDLISLLSDFDVKLVITLLPQLANAEVWKAIAKVGASSSTVIGYDLINEPSLEDEERRHWSEVEGSSANNMQMEELCNRYQKMIEAIREVDSATPIIVEPSFWGQAYALESFLSSWSQFESPNTMVSIHFYEPRLLTWQIRNQDRFSFPCRLPVFDVKYSETMDCSVQSIKQRIAQLAQTAHKYKIDLFIGEVGICRTIGGASGYLEAVFGACAEEQLSCFIYAFRDPDWEAMDYELGTDRSNESKRQTTNALLDVIKGAIGQANNM